MAKKITLEQLKRLAEDISRLKEQKSELKGKYDSCEEEAKRLGYKDLADAQRKYEKMLTKIDIAEAQLTKDYQYFKDQYEKVL
jgi:uncharacterized protein (UPF0335 family)